MDWGFCRALLGKGACLQKGGIRVPKIPRTVLGRDFSSEIDCKSVSRDSEIYSVCNAGIVAEVTQSCWYQLFWPGRARACLKLLMRPASALACPKLLVPAPASPPPPRRPPPRRAV